ncbi:MAG: hypothetical protein ACP5MT_03310, partial [Candidatus Acidifodinimicrobium sp.]
MEEGIIQKVFGKYAEAERFADRYLQRNPDPKHADLVLFIDRLAKETSSNEEDIIKQVSSSGFVASV